MGVIVDTSVWSLALRRRPKDRTPRERTLTFLLRDLIVNGEAMLLGIVRQELLTGISDQLAFEAVRQRLLGFDDLAPGIDDYERAAEYANVCMRAGIASTTADMLICAVAVGRDMPILTTDDDFKRYAAQVQIQLLSPSSGGAPVRNN